MTIEIIGTEGKPNGQVTCLLCKSVLKYESYDTKEINWGDDGKIYTTITCPKCNLLIYLDSRPANWNK